MQFHTTLSSTDENKNTRTTNFCGNKHYAIIQQSLLLYPLCVECNITDISPEVSLSYHYYNYENILYNIKCLWVNLPPTSLVMCIQYDTLPETVSCTEYPCLEKLIFPKDWVFIIVVHQKPWQQPNFYPTDIACYTA